MSRGRLDPQAQELLERIRQAGIPPYHDMEPVVARVFYDKACATGRGSPPEPMSVSDFTIPGPASPIPVRSYLPRQAGNLPVLVFYHGGGYTIGSLESHDAVCRHLCMEADCMVVAVDYRLAPEHRFPAAIDDAWSALCWVADNARSLGGDPDRIAVGGDSAGGNLAAVTCLWARANGGPALRCQLLIYPGTDMTAAFPSRREFGDGYLLTARLIDWFHDNYLGTGIDPLDWRVSPLHAPDLGGLPTAHIITAGFDPLQDEGKALAERLREHGVETSFTCYEGMLHGFITQPRFLHASRAALSESAAFLRREFNGAKFQQSTQEAKIGS